MPILVNCKLILGLFYLHFQLPNIKIFHLNTILRYLHAHTHTHTHTHTRTHARAHTHTHTHTHKVDTDQLLLGLLYSGDLLSYHRQHLNVNTIELIKTCPSTSTKVTHINDHINIKCFIKLNYCYGFNPFTRKRQKTGFVFCKNASL